MTYIKISSGSSGYTGSSFSIHEPNNPTSNQNWRLLQTGQQGKARYLNNYYLDPTYEISGYSATDYSDYYRHRLDPNKKILIQYQFLPKVLDTRSNAWADISFGFATGSASSSFFAKTNSYGWVDATVHYKNVTRAGYDNYSYAAIGETIISHSESNSMPIAIHFKTTNDYSNVAGGFTYTITGDTGYTWFKFTELD